MEIRKYAELDNNKNIKIHGMQLKQNWRKFIALNAYN